MWDRDGRICGEPRKKTCLEKWTRAKHMAPSFVITSSQAIIVRLNEILVSYHDCYPYPDMYLSQNSTA
jgi:hypothetical protein